MPETDAEPTLDLSDRPASALSTAETASPADHELLRQSEHARLLARLETMPVIEQAKGIIMAQSRCTEAEAFDLLRRASQRSNIPVRELAVQIIASATQPVPATLENGSGHPGRTNGRHR